jgi:CSLREA domain-containing protein
MNPLIPGCLMRVMGQLLRSCHSASSPAGALRLLAAALLTGLMSAALFAPAVGATVITVTTTADENNSNGDCSLREAVIAANQDQAQGACPAGNSADTIKLPAGTYVLTITGTVENASLTGDLDISSDLTIDGAGQGDTEIDGNGIDRVLHILSGTVTLSDLTIANGDAGAENGGGVFNFGDVTIENSRIRDCTADSGGGIHMGTGTLTLIGSRIDGNTAEDGGAILFSSTGVVVHIIDSVISGNTATQGNGGGIFNSGITSLSNSTVSGNRAAKSGGGILTIGLGTAEVIMFSVTVANNTADSDGDGDGDGGGIYAPPLGTFNARNSLFGNNRDLSPSGDVFPDCSGVLFGVGYNLIENVAEWSRDAPILLLCLARPDLLDLRPGWQWRRQDPGVAGGQPAINAGNPFDCIGPNGIVLDTDQRGFARKGLRHRRLRVRSRRHADPDRYRNAPPRRPARRHPRRRARSPDAYQHGDGDARSGPRAPQQAL